MDELDRLLKFLDEQKQGCVEKVLKLIGEDAPKNKFSIVAGRMEAIEDMESEIRSMKDARESKRG